MASDAVQSYEAEQQRLQAEYDGARGEIEITAPKEPEVNPEVYRDVEPMLYRGFITVSAEFSIGKDDLYLVFKSLNHHEFELLRFSGGLRNERVAQSFWNTFLAYGVFMIDGVNVLVERERWIPKIAETFEAFPKEAKAKIIRHVAEANRRASRAVMLSEAYAMENASRYRWMQLKGLDLTAPAVTGIEGTQRLGLNWAQQLWRALNLVEDRNEQHERDWENAKFVGSCFAGKGIAKVYNQDNDRRRKDKEDRIARKDRLLREIVLGETVPDKTHMLPGAVMTVPRTVDELTDQLRKDLNNEKDWHDKVIEEHEIRIREQYHARQTQQETVARENATQFGNQYVVGNADMTGLTPKEVEKRVAQTKQLQAQAASRMQIHPEADEKTQQFLDKWGVVGPEVSTEISTTDRDISGAMPLPQPRPKTTIPFRRK
jgi:hypothetical protein